MIKIKLTDIDAAELRKYVDCILSTTRCQTSPQLARLLEYLVLETAAGRGERLKQYVIGTNALGRPDSFDPDTDPIVRVTIGRLRKLLDCYYSQEGRAEVLRLEIPVGSYIPHIAVRLDASSPTPASETAPQLSGLALSVAPGSLPHPLLWLMIGLVAANFVTLQYLLARL